MTEKPRKLTMKYDRETIRELKLLHGVDFEKVIMEILEKELAEALREELQENLKSGK